MVADPADPFASRRAEWLRLIREALPAAARSRPDWPIRLDHCFARVVLDTVCDRTWREAIAAPAWRNMDAATLERAIALATAILDGDADLAELNRRSLFMRGKAGGVHRRGEVR